MANTSAVNAVQAKTEGEKKAITFVQRELRRSLKVDYIVDEASIRLGLDSDEITALSERDDLSFLEAYRIANALGLLKGFVTTIDDGSHDFRQEARLKYVFKPLLGEEFPNWDAFQRAFEEEVHSFGGASKVCQGWMLDDLLARVRFLGWLGPAIDRDGPLKVIDSFS